jgi:peptide/nickel transport system permease protein
VRTYILKRLLLMIPTLVGITLLAYAIVRLAPGDPVAAMIRAQAGDINPRVFAKEADAIRERLGLKDYNVWGDDPEQIDPAERVVNAFWGYGRWVAHMVRGDFGESMKFRTSEGSKSPAALYYERAHITIPLNIIAQIIIFSIAIPIGLASARYRGKFFDRASSVGLLLLWSIPAILAGTLLIGFLGRGGIGLWWFPSFGLHSSGHESMGWWDWTLDLLWHVTLPITCMVYGGLAYLAKLGRASLLENLRADYVRTARAKGVPERRVVYVHALRNSLIPMITVMVMMLPALIGGSVIVEKIFSIHGMGTLVIGAAQSRDLSVIMFGTLLYGTLTLVALLVADILYAWVDPRVRFE